MHDASPPASPFDQFCQKAFWFLGQAALFLLLWFSLMKFPLAPAADLDPSWRMVLGYAEVHNFQFGTDLVFTYGPLGYLLPATNIGDHYWHHIVWQLAGNGLFAIAIFAFGRLFHGWRKALYYGYFLCFCSGYIDVVHITSILLLSLALARDSFIARRWLVSLIVLALSILALIKFTNLLLSCFAVGCVVLLHLHRRRWLDAGLLAGLFTFGFLAGWKIWGQHFGNLPAYIRNSLNVSGGYTEGMGIYGPASMLYVGLAANLSIAAYCVLTLYRPKDRPRALATTAIALVALFLNWKHGFVRADGHVLASFFCCLFFAASAPHLLQDDGGLRRLKGALLILCAACCMAGTWMNAAFTVTDAVSSLNWRVKESVVKVLNLPHLPQLAREEFATASQLSAMPAAKSVIGNKTVDVLGSEQAYALFNGLNYRPRPVFQGYFPYTDHLLRLNEAFMYSDRAPEYILQKVQTLDYRLPSLDDSLTTRYLYHHYTYLLNDHDFLLWQRNPPNPALDQKTPISSTTVKFGERVQTPQLGNVPIWCEIDVQHSLLGRIRNFLYKPPFLKIAVADGERLDSSYRLVSSMARAGFLLAPYFTSNHTIQRFEEGSPISQATSFAIEMDPADQIYFKPTIGVKLYRLPPFPRSQAEAGLKAEVRYRVFSQVPTMVNAPYATDILVENGKEVLLAHPPSSIEFELNAKDRHATGKFGLIANAYTKGNTSDGAEFVIDWVNGQGEVSRIFNRLLKPLTVGSDRGMQSFDLVVPPGGGRLILRTTPGPDGNLAFDWTFWTDIKFAP